MKPSIIVLSRLRSTTAVVAFDPNTVPADDEVFLRDALIADLEKHFCSAEVTFIDKNNLPEGFNPDLLPADLTRAVVIEIGAQRVATNTPHTEISRILGKFSRELNTVCAPLTRGFDRLKLHANQANT